MAKTKKKTQTFFPQISRKITALALGGLFLFTLWGEFLAAPSLKLKTILLKDYQNPRSHLKLAEAYLKNNDFESAKKEILLAKNLGQDTSQKEEILSFQKIVEEKIGEPAKIRQEITSWEKISRDFPGYRDAYLHLAKLYYQILEKEKARQSLQKARELDPNFPSSQELQKIFGD